MAEALCAATKRQRSCAADARGGGKGNRSLRAELIRMREREIVLKKSVGHTLRNARERYAEIEAMKGEHSIRWLCRLWDVAPSGYYRLATPPPGPRQREDAAIAAQIAGAHEASEAPTGRRAFVEDLREAGTRHEQTPLRSSDAGPRFGAGRKKTPPAPPHHG